MLVDAVPMRRDGRKLPRVDVLAMSPHRGRLVIVTIDWRSTANPHQPKEPTTFVRLYKVPPPTSAAESAWVLPELRDGRFKKWDGHQGVIVGIEDNVASSAGDAARPQAWWVRAVDS